MALAISAGAVIYSYTTGYIGGIGGGHGSAFGLLSLDSAVCSDVELVAYVRNVGKGTILPDKAYVDSVSVHGPGYLFEVNNPGSDDNEIPEGGVGMITLRIPSGFEPGNSYEVRIIASDGATLIFTTKVKKITQTGQLIYYEDYVDNDISNVDSSDDIGSLINFLNVQSAPDSSYSNLAETLIRSSNVEDYVDINTSNVDSGIDKGSHSNFDNEKSVDGLPDILIEEFTGESERGFKVYHDSFEFISGTTYTPSIGGSVDTDHAFLIFYTAGSSAPREPDEGSCYGYISSSNQLTFERHLTSPGLYVSWFVIECLNQEFAIRGRGAIELSSTIQTNTASVSGVQDPYQCMVVYGGHMGEGGSRNDWEDCFCNLHLTDSTTVTAKRHFGSVGTKTTIRYEVVEWSSDFNVYTGEITVSSTTVTDLISGGGNPDDAVIDMDRSIILANWWAEQNGIQQVQVYYSITDTNEVTFGQYSGGRNPLVRWYVIEFPPDAAPDIQRFSYNWDPSTAPNNVRNNAISAVETNRTFIRMSCSTSGTGTAFRRDFNLPRLDSNMSWSETQYNPIAQSYDRHETRASVIELPYLSGYANYELDLEVQFINVSTNDDVTELCVKAVATDPEDLGVEVWNNTASSWSPIFSDIIENDWTNLTITSHISDDVTLRFIGGNEANDTSADSWDIDAVLLHQYNQSYLLDQEMQWNQCNSTRDNAQLCIYAGPLDSEDLDVYIWDKTLSLWSTVFSGLSSGDWNNVTIKSFLIDDGAVTIRFLDEARSSDTVQDSWDIDSVLIRTWDDS